jgi:hypothetical protein
VHFKKVDENMAWSLLQGMKAINNRRKRDGIGRIEAS